MKDTICKHCGAINLHASFRCFLAPKKAISKQSKSRAEEDKVYDKLNIEFRKTHTRCEARLAGCTGKPDHVHHLYSGASRDRFYADSATWKMVCHHCHHLVHDVMSKEECYALDLKRTY